jgi:tRNA nucleotidyltransferase/poly(A) polymerase
MFDFFEVGGAVRDRFLGIESKDVDFACVAQNPDQFDTIDDAFNALIQNLKDQGFKGFATNNGNFIIKEEFLTVRANVPDDHVLKSRTTVADFVLARKDGPSSDSRRPDWVLPGTLMDDLSRRDFTVNAMALNPITGMVIDPFGGQTDLENRILRFVGNPMDRIAEDGLRVLRMLRFFITKNLKIETGTWFFVVDNQNHIVQNHLQSVSGERIREELTKMFNHDTMGTLTLLEQFPAIRRFVLRDSGLKLMPTFKQF